MPKGYIGDDRLTTKTDQLTTKTDWLTIASASHLVGQILRWSVPLTQTLFLFFGAVVLISLWAWSNGLNSKTVLVSGVIVFFFLGGLLFW
jgi:hypothetical protein